MGISFFAVDVHCRMRIKNAVAGLDLHFAFGEITVATSLRTGGSKCPPDTCIQMGSSLAP